MYILLTIFLPGTNGNFILYVCPLRNTYFPFCILSTPSWFGSKGLIDIKETLNLANSFCDVNEARNNNMRIKLSKDNK